jgi:chemotaxis methyl-accepting protein methylase
MTRCWNVIIAIIQHIRLKNMNRNDLEHLLKAILPSMGYQWRRLNRRNVRRKLRRRMEELRIYDVDKYIELLQSDMQEMEILDSLLRVTITRFFRNQTVWMDLERLLISYLENTKDGFIAAWSAGCAGGEESFTLAMLMMDLTDSALESRWSILGTDSDLASIERSRGTSYMWGSVREVPMELLERWFSKTDDYWRLNETVLDSVRFEINDILRDPTPDPFNLVLLRNSILTYNTVEVQRTVLEKVWKCLIPPGLIVIGRKESIPEGTGFERVKGCIYRKTQA